jgi:2,3-dihydroxybiphenyl 1,2-dioxygenase
MFPGLTLGYLNFAVSDLAAWRTFATEMLGLPAPLEHADGSLGFRLDDRIQRLIVRPGEADDLVGIGLECRDDETLARLASALADAGYPAEACEVPGVERAVRSTDPSGLTVELFVGAVRAATPFSSDAFPGGFVTGDHGLGHAVLAYRDLAAMRRYYVETLGFRVSDRLEQRIGPVEIRGLFLHCNPRHHSIAILDAPLPRRCHHFMLQAADLASVGRAYERAQKLGVPLSLTLGQHPDPDPTMSFYAATPSGFDFEIGAGGGLVHEAWAPGRVKASPWGHKPTFRLKWQTMRALVRHRFARRALPAATT